MKNKFVLILALCGILFTSCVDEKNEKPSQDATATANTEDFDYQVDQFADLKILRYQIPSWDDLTLKEQKLVYYLTQAGLAGRDIMWAQNYRHNLAIRSALENIYQNYSGDKESDDWKNFEIYLKRVWFSNGIHHHYSNSKLKPDFNKEYLQKLLSETNTFLEGEAFEVIFNDRTAKK